MQSFSPLLFLATLCFVRSVEAFHINLHSRSSLPWRQGQLRNSKEEEIAKLEEQLRKLKEGKEDASSVDTESKEEEKLEDVPLEMFLTEQWKEQEADGSSSGGGITVVLYVIAAVLGLVLFSQVPIGQEDLSKYSVGNSPSEQIDLGDLNRARRSGDL